MAQSDSAPTVRAQVTPEERLRLRYLPALTRWAAARVAAPAAQRGVEAAAEVFEAALRGRDHLLFATEGAFLLHLRQELARRLDIGAGSAVEDAAGAEPLRRYEQALARLSSLQRQAVVARIEMGLGYEELAEALGEPHASAAREAASQALLALAQEMSRETR